MSEHNEKKHSDAYKKDLARKLEENSLNSKYWLPVLETKLGISNVQSFQHVQHEDIATLESAVRYNWEKNALYKLFNVQDRSKDYHDGQEQNTPYKDNEENTETIKQPGKIPSEKKTHQNEFLKRLGKININLTNYKLRTKQTLKQVFGDQSVSDLKETRRFLQEIKSWQIDDVESNLSKLHEYKNDLSTKTPPSVWVDECLSDKGLQNFFLRTIESYKDSSIPEKVKLLIRQLLEPHVYSVKKFRKLSFIMERINEVESDRSEFKEFSDILQKAKEDFKQRAVHPGSSSKNTELAEQKATSAITQALCSLLKSMRSMKDTDQELLILCIVNDYGFSVQNYHFKGFLRWEDIELMSEQVNKAHTEYKSMREIGTPQAQAFVLLTGLRTRREETSELIQERLSFMLQFLAGSLSSEVNEILNKHTEEASWKILKESLQSFICNPIKREFSEITAHVVRDLESVHQETENPETNSQIMEPEFNKDFFRLLERLSLETYYPQKMNKKHFHVIRKNPQSENQNINEKQIPFLFLEKLLSLDYRARYLQSEQKSETNPARHINLHKKDKLFSLDSILDNSDEESQESPPSRVSGVHPMDIQMAIFHCADDIARQYIYTKLSFCLFAVPLLVPNPNTKRIEFPLWAFQEIKKKWKSKTKEPNKTNEKHIAEAETPCVTFIRFGSSPSSKSQILNSLMGNPKNQIFFHRHCKGSTRDGLLMNGVVEIAWYCPGGKDSDLFDDCIAFTNLRGDAREHEQQVKFLLEVSAVFVILLTDADTKDTRCKKVLEEILKSSKSFILLLSDKEQTQRKSGIVKIGLKNKNKAELIQEITDAITSVLDFSTPQCSLNKCTNNARKSGFLVDEDKHHCEKNKEKSQIVMAVLKEKQLVTMKTTHVLPLQGPLWHEWCQKDKELTRLKGKSSLSIEQQQSDIKSRKVAIRRDQLNRAFPLNDFMRSFIQILHSGSQTASVYFLQWLKIYLDKLSSENLYVLHQKYHDLWTQIQKKKEDKLSIATQEKDLESLSTQINDSSFGLEHVLREVGQIYEATEILHIKKDCVSMLPDIAAKLMISGYPVELMDGDAAHVPLTWITAVLDKVTEMIGDKKIFVLSVLGIQSTGKSTLLNAMFGLQFAVSAGRCTRGAFMQLIEVEETLRERRFDFVLVIDTEGLRAIELSNKATHNHDNELATFVIGLGNITLINIFGENPSEIQDILQIAVQAFLRMKQVRIRPSCLFVHQNVGEITAKEKNMEGRRKLQENLNKMTMIAAEQEHCEVTGFNDVIIFDVNTHIHYFTQLWEGDPPMAPPNPGYSQNVQNLKQIILDIGRNESPSNILTISQFKSRVMDLWNALLHENFVFSFRNSLEIAAYNKLETAYGQWTWDLRKHMLSIENEISNHIQNGKMQRIDKSEINEKLQETFDAVMEKVKEFFSNEKDRDIFIQWKENANNRVTNVKRELIEEAKKKADELITSKNNGKKMNDRTEKCEDELFKRSRDLALRLRGQELNEKIMKENFNKMWNSWILQVQSEIPPTETPPIRKDMENILLERFNKHPELQKLITESSTWRDVNEEFSRYISMKSENPGWKCDISKQQMRHIKATTCALEFIVNKYLKKKEEQKMDYQISYFYEMLYQIEMEVETELKTFRFKFDYLPFVTLYLFQKAGRRFIQMSDAFKKANNPLRHLESKRSQFFQSFSISCDGKQRITSLADFLRDRLQESLREAVYKKAAIDTANDMKCNFTVFNGNRSKLEFHLMKSLAEKEDFQSYITYIDEPKTAFGTYIRECVDQYHSGTNSSNITNTLKVNLDRFTKLIHSAIEKSSSITIGHRGDVSSWLDTFCSELSAHLTLSNSDLKGVKYQDIKDIGFLEEAMTKALETMVENLWCNEFSMCVVSNIKVKPYEILYEQLAGCWETCPFCKAVCTNTVPGHKEDHSVQFHRPRAIEGGFWYKTDHLVTDICSSLVASDCSIVFSEDNQIPYKEYRTAGPRYFVWSITPDLSSLNYWKWVVCRFQSDFEKHYKLKFMDKGEIPSQWREITKEEAISEIDGYISSLK